MTIEEVKIFHTIDTIHSSIGKVFVVENFCNCSEDILKFDSIVCFEMSDKSFSYTFGFYKKSDITNIENLDRFPKDFGRYSDKDIIIQYVLFKYLPFLIRYDYYIDKVNMLEIERKLVCVDGKAVKYIEDNK